MRLRMRISSALIGLVLLVSYGCQDRRTDEAARKINLYQDWAIQPGDELAGYQVQSGLGDIAIDLRGGKVYMPFDGLVQPADDTNQLCIVISSATVPAYLFRLCGLKQPRLGEQAQGTPLGTGQVVAFATLRKQSNGTWAMVEPAEDLLTTFLSKP